MTPKKYTIKKNTVEDRALDWPAGGFISSSS